MAPRTPATFFGAHRCPVCAICNRQVANISVRREEDKAAWRITVQCHGATLDFLFGDPFFALLTPGEELFPRPLFGPTITAASLADVRVRPEAGLLSSWRFDQSGNDRAGGNDLSRVGAPTVTTESPFDAELARLEFAPPPRDARPPNALAARFANIDLDETEDPE